MENKSIDYIEYMDDILLVVGLLIISIAVLMWSFALAGIGIEI